MHIACLSHFKNKTLGACGCKEPVPHPDGCIAPHRHRRVATPEHRGQGDGPTDCKRGWQDAAPACTALVFTRSGTEVEAESGGRPWEIWWDQRLSHGESSRHGGNVPRSAAVTVSPRRHRPLGSVRAPAQPGWMTLLRLGFRQSQPGDPSGGSCCRSMPRGVRRSSQAPLPALSLPCFPGITCPESQTYPCAQWNVP